MTIWKGFTTEQVRTISREKPPLGASAGEVTCPACGQAAVRWYSYTNPWRPQSQFYYVWCSVCHHFYGEAAEVSGWNLTDPLGGMSKEERLDLESDLDTFFSTLDDLWGSGELPQLKK